MREAEKVEQNRFKSYKEELTVNGQLLYVGRLLQRGANRYGKLPALICNDVTITYQQLYQRAVAFSYVLLKQGVKPGDRVLLFFENSIEFYIGYYAVLQIGAVIVPLNTFLHERELHHIVDDAQPQLIIAAEKLRERLMSNEVTLPPVFTEAAMPITCDDQQLAAFAIHDRPQDEMTALLYTSGTTGLPKGAMLSSRNIITNVIQTLSRLHPEQGDRLFGLLPLFHSFSQNVCVWTALFSGCTIIVVPHIDRRAIIQHLNYKPTYFLGVPVIYGLLCMMRNAPLQSVKMFVCGADALPDKIRSLFALLYGRHIAIGYGLTEASPVVSTALEDEVFVMGDIGKPLIGITCRFKDEHGNDVPEGQVGELVIQGDNVMLGYYRSPEVTAKAIRDGWLYTGDLAYQDKEGRIVITGRSKDLIIHKGFNIYPQEVENVIMSYPNVMRVAVVGVPDEQMGEVPVAYVQLRQEEANSEKHLRDHCRQNLAAYKIPKEFICSTIPLPTTATGKIDKKRLKKNPV
jgi:long-chain acyl-CoA synthetase